MDEQGVRSEMDRQGVRSEMDRQRVRSELGSRGQGEKLFLLLSIITVNATKHHGDIGNVYPTANTPPADTAEYPISVGRLPLSIISTPDKCYPCSL